MSEYDDIFDQPDEEEEEKPKAPVGATFDLGDQKAAEPPRNPTVVDLPGAEPVVRRCCPKCQSPDYGGRKVMGVITFTCLKCKNKWQGGLGIEPIDPTKPMPPMNPADKPDLDFFKKRPTDDRIREQRNPRNPVPAFRRGALIPEDGEE